MSLLVKIAIVILLLIYPAIFLSNLTSDLWGKKEVKVEASGKSESTPPPPKKNVPTDNKWYVISNQTGKCIVDEGPIAMMKNLRTLGQKYDVVDDIVEDGKPMKVRLNMEEGLTTYSITYYRGKALCQADAKERKQTLDAEINRYK